MVASQASGASGGTTPSGTGINVGNTRDIFHKLRVLFGEYLAGNTSNKVKNLIKELLSYL
jgi:hypothetical protein